MADGIDEMFDEEEQDPPVAFEQDPDSDDIGDGYFVYADGRKEYKSSYDEAMRLNREGKASGVDVSGQSAPEPEPVTPIGLEPPEEEKGRGATATGQRFETALDANEEARFQEWKRRYAPNDSGADYDLRGAFKAGVEPDPENGHWPDTWKKPNHPTFSDQSQYARLAPSKAGSWRGETYVPPKQLPLKDRSLRVDMQDQQSQTQSGGQSSSVQRTGSAVPREEFEANRDRVQQSYGNQVQDQQVRDMETGNFYADRRRQLMQDAMDAEAKVTAAQAQNAQRQQAAQQKYQEIAARKEDPFEGDGGIIGTIMAGIAVYLGGISSGMLGGPNQAMEAVQDNRKAAIAAQRDQKDSMLRQLERELGSLEAAVPALEAKMNRAAAMKTEAFLADEKSLESRQKGAQFISALRTEAALKDQEALKNYYGNIAQSQAQQQQTTATVGTSTATSEGESRAVGAGLKGPGRPTFKQVLETAQEMEGRGYKPEQIAKYIQEQGYEPQTGESDTEFKRRSDLAKDKAAQDKSDDHEKKALASEQAVKNFYEKAGLKLVDGEWVVNDDLPLSEGGGIVPPGFVESVNPGSDNSISAAGEAAAEAFGRLQSDGAINKDELPRFRDQVGINTANRKQLAARANALMPLIRERRPENKRGSEKVPGDWR
ncbi:MAG TPA: hypothetical protein VJU61_20005 [Polyangiaceae bacterium]|nr:hypothetical protein [Polyangiaceae bacterium]